MMRALACGIGLLMAATVVAAKEPAEPGAKDKQMSGMSIVGNDDAPKSLVIVPWKSSDLGTGLDVSRAIDDGRQPVDRDVFMRELEYYQIRAESGEAHVGDTR
jgi:hypothetical protein